MTVTKTKTFHFKANKVRITIEVPEDYDCAEFSPHGEALIFSVKDHLVMAVHRGTSLTVVPV